MFLPRPPFLWKHVSRQMYAALHRSATTQDFVGVMSGCLFGIAILLYIDKSLQVRIRRFWARRTETGTRVLYFCAAQYQNEVWEAVMCWSLLSHSGREKMDAISHFVYATLLYETCVKANIHFNLPGGIYNMYCWQIYAKSPNLEYLFEMVLTTTTLPSYYI